MNNSKNIIYGIHSVLESLEANAPINKIYLIQSNKKNNTTIKKIIKLAKSNNIKIIYLDKNKLESLIHSNTHQGVAAEICKFSYKKIDNLLDKIKNNEKNLIVVLDHITDSGNLGAIIRSAEVFGARSIIIPKNRSANVNSHTYKTSAGAINNIDIVMVKNLASTIDLLKENGFWIYGCSEHSDINIFDETLDKNTVLVFGSEDNGISKLMLEKCDFLVKLPQYGKTESLNVTQAATTCMYEWIRQTHNK